MGCLYVGAGILAFVLAVFAVAVMFPGRDSLFYTLAAAAVLVVFVLSRPSKPKPQ